ncbi:MAG: YlxR family protein [Desulfobulbales bacterium]
MIIPLQKQGWEHERLAMKVQPVRSCLGCQQRFSKNMLMKFVLDNGVLKYDSKGTGQGRSAYCCNNKKCLDVFFRQKKKLSRAFRVPGDQISTELKDWE